MRMRKKPYAEAELHGWPYFIQEPAVFAGRWQEAFSEKRPLRLELGCGKGRFISVAAAQDGAHNYLGIDLKDEVLVVAKRNIEAALAERGAAPGNALIMSQDIERICDIMAPADRVEDIYINFPNPWPKPRHQKRRLTHTRQLEKYKTFLAPGGRVYFKTDDGALFDDSLLYFEESGFEITYLTRNAHCAPDLPFDIRTEHEEMFSEQGVPIKFLTAIQK